MSSTTRLSRKFEELKQAGKKGFISYITAGDPTLKDTADIVKRLVDAGVDIIELGIPFSDPLADGKTNQMSAERALSAGTTPRGVIDAVKEMRATIDIPIVCYSYLNPLYAMGFEKAVKTCSRSGVDGLLILDMALEESDEYRELMSKHNVDNICLVTPTSPDARIKKITAASSGFVYCVSRAGVTGVRKEVDSGAKDLVARARATTQLPIALGFGISTPKQAQQVASYADAVVVGSAIVQRLSEAGTSKKDRAAVASWVKSMVQAVKEI